MIKIQPKNNYNIRTKETVKDQLFSLLEEKGIYVYEEPKFIFAHDDELVAYFGSFIIYADIKKKKVKIETRKEIKIKK